MAQPAIPRPGAHGDDAVAVATALGISPHDLLDLAAPMNPVAPDPRPTLALHLDALRHYPDERATRGILAEHLEVDGARLVLTNGGAEAIALVAAEVGSGWFDVPEFSLYARHLPTIDPSGPRWASNPHSPSGRLAASNENAGVWDEAFFPLATGRWSRGDLGAVVVGSLTKLLACPGLRAGYVIARDPDEAARLERRRPAWSVNSLAVAALPDLLATVDLPRWCMEIAARRADLESTLADHGYRTLPSDAPWVLVPDSPGLRERLARRHVLVRDCASFGLPDHHRLSVPDLAGLDRLRHALA